MNRFELIRFEIGYEALEKATPRLRNQIVGCMHAHNELAALNRIFLFSLHQKIQSNNLSDAALGVQGWLILQLLAGKLVETWNMIQERFLKANPAEPILGKLDEKGTEGLTWLITYFGKSKSKDNTLQIIRDKTAFHYDQMNLASVVKDLPETERMIYVAEHPANALYYLGSAMVFRAAFTHIAEKTNLVGRLDLADRVDEGWQIAMHDAKTANSHMFAVLYGLLRALLDELLGHSLKEHPQTRIPIVGAPKPAMVGLPTFVAVSPDPAK